MLDVMRVGRTGRRAQPKSDGRTVRLVAWPTVALLAVLMAGATGFLTEALQGATGDIGRSQHPFRSWVRDSVILLPIFVAVVLTALALGRRRFGGALHAFRPVVLTSLLIVGVGTLVGIAALTVNAAYNYHLQSDQLGLAHSLHSTALSGETVGDVGSAGHDHRSAGGSCTGTCVAQRQTLETHVKGVEMTSGLLLVSNVVIVGWVVALRGGRLDVARADSTAEPAIAVPGPGPVPAEESDIGEYEAQHSR